MKHQLIIFLYGTHGDELPFTQILANLFTEFLTQSTVIPSPLTVKTIGPIDQWACSRLLHFSENGTDLNRQHVACLENIPPASDCLDKAFSVFTQCLNDVSLNSSFFLDQCRLLSVDLKSVLSLPQSSHQGFFGYTSHDSISFAKSIRLNIVSDIHKLISLVQADRVCLFDLHAGIGMPGILNFQYYTNPQVVKHDGAFLVDGIARDISFKCIDCYVIEAGISGTLKFFDSLFLELLFRFPSVSATPCRDNVLAMEQFRIWENAIRRYFVNCFSEKLLDSIFSRVD